MSNDTITEPTLNLATPNDAAMMPQVIRRDLPGDTSGKPRVVGWVGHKVAYAVRAAAVACGVDEALGAHVQAEIEFRLRRERPSFIHIEQLQDMVEETLMELNQGKVALAYAKYRAKRSVLRELAGTKAEEGTDDSAQLELATPDQLIDLRARLSFGRIGLKPQMPEEELIARLLRSVSLNLSPEERRDTIILNAKSLLDADADARFYAARILLTFIYEETLPWKISDGVEALKEAHKKAFIDYIPHGIKLGRLDPKLAEFNLKQLAEALDPFADLQFDYIGIQTLYDRYLIHTQDQVSGRKRRLEAPQIFWLRVAMGLALGEKERETRAIEFYGIYKTRRACSSTPTLFNAGTQRPQPNGQAAWVAHGRRSVVRVRTSMARTVKVRASFRS